MPLIPATPLPPREGAPSIASLLEVSGFAARAVIDGKGQFQGAFVLAANYITSYNYSAGSAPPVLGHAYMLQIGLRTLANTTSSGAGGL